MGGDGQCLLVWSAGCSVSAIRRQVNTNCPSSISSLVKCSHLAIKQEIINCNEIK